MRGKTAANVMENKQLIKKKTSPKKTSLILAKAKAKSISKSKKNLDLFDLCYHNRLVVIILKLTLQSSRSSFIIKV